MNFRTLVASMTFIGSVNTLIPNINNVINKQQLSNTTNTISQIAQKYESTTDKDVINKINLDNFLNDINNSSIKTNLKNEINTTFTITNSNSGSDSYLWYQGNHGTDMANSYNQAIDNYSSQVLVYLSFLTLVSNVAHYYGDNGSMDPLVRQAAITKDITLITTFINRVKAEKLINLNFNTGVFSDITSWSNDAYKIISDVLSQNYQADALLSEFNDINYDNLASYNSTLHATDDYIYGILSSPNYFMLTGWKNVDDYFYLGDSSNSQKIKISFTNTFNYWLQYAFLTNLEEFSFNDPSNFSIVMS